MFSTSFDVPVSPARAYDFLAANYFTNHSSWDPGVVATEPVDEGPVRAGMRGREVRRFLGTQTTTFRVAECEPPGRFRLTDDPGVWALDRTYEIAPRAGGATVTFVFDMSPRAAWFRLIHPLVRGVIHRQVRANMERLQALLSRSAT